MELIHLERAFTRMGAPVRFVEGSRLSVDVQDGWFVLGGGPFEVLEVRPALRHLLLMAREDEAKHKFLCGHDERHWFAAAVPGRSVTSVLSAMEALKPGLVLTRQAGLSGVQRRRRKNSAFIRQGEWFFLPAPDLVVPAREVRRREPLSRGGGKPHIAELCYRTGGEFSCTPGIPAG